MTTRRCTALSFLLFVAACGGADAAAGKPQAGGVGATPDAGKPQAPIALAEAKTMFESLCFTCHGLTGHGDGPGAAALDPKPRSFVDEAWQASVTDEHIKKVIVFGGAAVGKSPMMIANPQLKGNDAVLNGLVQVIRGFRGK